MKFKHYAIPAIVFLILTGIKPAAFSQDIQPSPSWNHDLGVSTADQIMDGQTYPCYYVSIYETTEKEANNLLEDELKKYARKVSGKDFYTATEAKASVFGNDVLELRSKILKAAPDNVFNVYVAVSHNGMAISYDGDKEADGKARVLVQQMAVDMNKAVVQEQIDAQKKKVKDAEKELKSAQKDEEKLEKDKSGTEKDIDKTMSKSKDLNSQVEDQQKAISNFQNKIAKDRTADNLSKLEDMRKKLADLQKQQSKLTNDEIDSRKSVSDTESKMPDAKKVVDSKKEALKKEQKLLNQLQDKLAAIK